MVYVIMMAVLIVGIDCRSLLPSGMDETSKYWESGVLKSKDSSLESNGFVSTGIVDFEPINKKIFDYPEELRPFIVTQGRKLEKLFAEFAERTADPKDHSRRANQWLKQLKLIMKEFATENDTKFEKISDTKTNGILDSSVLPQDKQILKNVNSLKDFLDSTGDFDIFYQDRQNDERHVKSRFDDASSSFFKSHDKSVEEDDIVDSKNHGDQLIDMMIDAENQLGRIRKYFEKLCRKHHSVSSPVGSLESNPDYATTTSQGQKLSML
ncbi:uncharacterized protein LOC107263879 [Cephus cinctus]|uniref:Uncharacterized protein LOC107263879 n=1 Tax=Cephus cinctus TaxID=211228 RepID=A0AAJ7BIR9_CEPCN|nr:uncharacterized protein LOC107263879 [Cephus cinctus]